LELSFQLNTLATSQSSPLNQNRRGTKPQIVARAHLTSAELLQRSPHKTLIGSRQSYPLYSLCLSAHILLAPAILRQWRASCATVRCVCNRNLGLRDPNVARCICAYTVRYVNIETVLDQNITSACHLKHFSFVPVPIGENTAAQGGCSSIHSAAKVKLELWM
jgi:hypothetical protein